MVNQFEAGLAEILKCHYVVATSSGTSAIHLALLSLGVGHGDEVVCATFTFCASANPIVYCGARPVFVDSERDTWNMDPELLHAAIEDRIRKTGKKPKAIIVVHLYGMPAKIDALVKIATQFDIPIVEDAAEALGSRYDDRALGTFAEVGILSFNGNKIITTSGGGAVCTSQINVASRVRYLRDDAKQPVPHYEHTEIGYNYRFSNILAALGCAQLRVLAERVARRREIFNYYRQALSNQLEFLTEPPKAFSNRWLTVALHAPGNIEGLRLELAKHKIESRQAWKPMHLQPVFADAPYYGNGVSDALFQTGICLPSGTALTNSDLERIVTIIRQYVYENSK